MKYFFILFITFSIVYSQNENFLLDDFDDLSDWEIFTSEGAELKFSSVEGIKGNCIKIDYNFKYGSGYCGIQKKLKLKLPDNYRFYFFIKANSPSNNFEIKFLDHSKENVWWYNNRNFDFPSDWKRYIVRKQNIQFAWGPTGDTAFEEFDFIEFTIASSKGGSGTIFIDELFLEKIPEEDTLKIVVYPEFLKPILQTRNGSIISIKEKNFEFIVGFNKPYEVGGIKIVFNNNFSKDLKIFESVDSLNWNSVLSVSNSTKNNLILQFRELETKYLKFSISAKNGIKISELKIFDYSFAETKNQIFVELGKTKFSKFLPDYFSNKASYWTVVGMDSDFKEALIDWNGMIEIDKNQFSILPFVESNNKILTHHHFQKKQYLEKSYLPIPVVEWHSKNLCVTIKTFSIGIPNKSSKLLIEYKVVSKRKNKPKIKFHLALLPFQVNPIYQFLNNPGGVSSIDSIFVSKNSIVINGIKLFYNCSNLVKATVFEFNKNDALSALIENNFHGSNYTNGYDKLNSALLTYDFSNRKSDTITIRLVYDYYSSLTHIDDSYFDALFNSEYQKTLSYWEFRLGSTSIKGSEKLNRLYNIVKSNLAYILINTDGAGIQPGSRSYERSWIRDGSLTSTALLRFGFDSEVKNFIKWYGKHIYESGKVPCVVDLRGPDPVDEHDSHGQFLYLLNAYFKFTKDTAFVKENYDLVNRIVNHIVNLINSRKTKEFLIDSLSAFFGIMPQSISHEGYSAKPMHSYWDNFFTYSGISSALEIANTLKSSDTIKFKTILNDFVDNLKNSLMKTIKNHGIDYIPGCVELGDFDPTSTSVVFFPCMLNKILPQEALVNTFDKYYDFISQRDVYKNFENFTPYELRNINAFIFRHQKERACELLEFILKYQRPFGWNHWAEVVWKDSASPRFIGDMPHTWVGSDYINAFRNLFAFEDEDNSTLKLLMGFDESFLDKDRKFEMKNVRTFYGYIDLFIDKTSDNEFVILVDGSLDLQNVYLEVYNFIEKPLKQIFINEKQIFDLDSNWIKLETLPSLLKIEF